MKARRTRSMGLLFALLAIVMQLGFSVALPKMDATDVLSASTLCHANGGGPAPATPHTPDCTLCPLCAAVASVAYGLPTSGPVLPLPRVIVLARSRVPSHLTTRPRPRRFAAQPRAPPLQV